MSKGFVLCAVLGVLSAVVTADSLPKLNIDIDSITVSGISAGGGFATQFHVAYSASLSGAAIFAGPPFFCAQANMEIALSSCMKDPALISVPALVKEAQNAAKINSIDDPKNMANDKVWIFTGSKDTVVKSGVVAKTKQFYSNFVFNTSSIKYFDSFPAEHAWITLSYGNTCDFLGDPFINNCSFDAVGNFLEHFYDGGVKAPGRFKKDNLLRFKQSHYVGDGIPGSISMGDAGFAYIPNKCANGGKCRLHVAFHGCNMDVATIGETFVIHNGLNDYAESNDMVVLYPQVKKSNLVPYNPQGCFDWWGYTGLNYSAKGGAQIKTVASMIHAITGNFGTHN